MSDEERIRDYLRARADVRVPDDLAWPATEPAARRWFAIGSAATWARLAVAGLVVVVVVAGVSLGLAAPTGPGHPSNVPAGTTAAPSDQGQVTFPSEVAGLSGAAELPVLSVADAGHLLASGKLDGQAVAVAGYFDQFTPSCPYPGRYIGPLEDWCRFVAFTDSRASAQLCGPLGTNGISCRQPSGTHLAPFFMSETSGNVWSWLNADPAGGPAALVLIGHAGDPRQWQCTAVTQAECARAFVVDRIAWANGHDVPPTVPETGNQQTGKAITPTMTLDQVAAAIGSPHSDLLTAAAFRAGDIATVDPRWNLAGDNIVWLARSIEPSTESNAGQTRPEVVWLVDDATGRVIDTNPQQLDVGYQPARLWQMATVHDVQAGESDQAAFYRVASGDGTVVFDGQVPGDVSGGQGLTTYGGGYGSRPLVLPAGRYSISVWLAAYDAGVMGTPRDECSTQVTLRPLDDVALNADYPPNGACTFRPAPTPSPGA